MTDLARLPHSFSETSELQPIAAVKPECQGCTKLQKVVLAAIESMKDDPNNVVTIGCGDKKLLGRCGLMQSVIPRDHYLQPDFDYAKAQLPMAKAEARGASKLSDEAVRQIAKR